MRFLDEPHHDGSALYVSSQTPGGTDALTSGGRPGVEREPPSWALPSGWITTGEHSPTPMPWNRPADQDLATLAGYRALLGLGRAAPALRHGGLR